jgi:hypothetical protein
MSPLFAYILIFLLWMLLASLTWLVAGAMCFVKRTRATGRCLAHAVAGSFPGVFVYQAAAAPIVALLLLVVRILWKLLEPGPSSMTKSPVVIVASIFTAFASITLVAAMSLFGFLEGWRIGWAVGQGQKLSDLIAIRPPFRVLRFIRRKFASQPEYRP